MNLFSTNFTKSACVIMLSLGLFACGNDKSTETTTSTSVEPATDVNNKIVTVAVTSDYMPFTFLDEHGGIIGFDADVISAIGKHKGFTVKFKPVDFDGMFDEVETEQSDVAMSSIFFTEDRNAKYSLTNPYYHSSPIYFYRADNAKLDNAELKTLNDLNDKGLDLVGTAGTKHIERIEGVSGSNSAKAVKSDFEGFTKVIRGEADVAMTDAAILTYTGKMHNITGENALKSVAYIGESGYVMVLKKDNNELLETLNDGLNELAQNGELKALEDKWFK